jgi:hypothetical protein
MLTRAGKTANLVSTLKLAEQSGAKMQEAKLRVKISQIIIFDTKLCFATLRSATDAPRYFKPLLSWLT